MLNVKLWQKAEVGKNPVIYIEVLPKCADVECKAMARN